MCKYTLLGQIQKVLIKLSVGFIGRTLTLIARRLMGLGYFVFTGIEVWALDARFLIRGITRTELVSI